MKLVFFDLETTGTQVPVFIPPEFMKKNGFGYSGFWYGHTISQIGALAYDNGKIVDEFEVKIKFKVDEADPEALEINSYDPEVWEREAISPYAAEQKLSKFLRKHADFTQLSKKGNLYSTAILIGHNVNIYQLHARS